MVSVAFHALKLSSKWEKLYLVLHCFFCACRSGLKSTSQLRSLQATSASGAGGSGEEAGSGPGSGNFECNICLDTAKDAVVSMCGHLFCWPCLHRWMETQQTRVLCPVCKASINRDKVIPLYGRGSSNDKDPRDKVPPRPQGQRQEAEQAQGVS